VIPILSPDPESPFPHIDKALEVPAGLLAAGGDLSPTRLINAYSHGIFPWYNEGEPILWWSPAPRCVIYPAEVHISRRLRRHYNQGDFTLSIDNAFEQVINACAESRRDQEGTWISGDMCEAYCHLHSLGIAHSLEVWQDNTLVGGIYGIGLGAVFFGESMFSRVNNASKVALVALCQQLESWGYGLLDCQISNPHLVSMGAVEIPRDTFKQQLQASEEPDHWQSDFCPPERL
jgi:leucyl/phenylalanyl-tRNA--protein transferase